jgi:hypothetical protein
MIALLWILFGVWALFVIGLFIAFLIDRRRHERLKIGKGMWM